MLSELIIENVAVIEKANIEFNDGFTCLTGETGAGKSIIIDSINAIMGDRVSKNIVRTGAQKASVVAVFENIEQSIIDKALEMDIDLSEECIVTRQISRDGKSSRRINSVPYPVSVIRTLFSDAINIHGQHDSQSLLVPSKHLGILDSFGTDKAIKALYSELYSEYISLNRQIKELENIDSEKRDSLDLLSFQVSEIEDAGISEREEEELLRERQIIRDSEKIITSLNKACGYLFGDDEVIGGISSLQETCSYLSNVLDYSPVLQSISDKLNDALAITEDAAYELRAYADDFDVDISSLDVIEERLDLYYKLKNKYGPGTNDVLSFYEKAKSELDKIEFAQENLDKLYSQRKSILSKLSISAERLTENRKKVFCNLSNEIQSALAFLNMPNVRFILSCKKKDFAADGQDNIEFLISANKGEEPKPLSKIASGGELSRIMLAIKSVLAEKEDTHTLIFDEIDTGVSGSAANKIGRLMKATANGKQILCVTHSAQIAAYADSHLFISKSSDESKTYTKVKELTDSERVKEIARIISGENITEVALMNAREMLNNAVID